MPHGSVRGLEAASPVALEQITNSSPPSRARLSPRRRAGAALAKRFEHGVAHGVAKLVVDLLEAVEVAVK